MATLSSPLVDAYFRRQLGGVGLAYIVRHEGGGSRPARCRNSTRLGVFLMGATTVRVFTYTAADGWILDPTFGFLHVRLQTWFPFTIHVYVNGHEWLARQLDTRGLGYRRLDNAFLALDDPGRTQRLADRFPTLPWPTILEGFARRVNPLLRDLLAHYRYYWATHRRPNAYFGSASRAGSARGAARPPTCCTARAPRPRSPACG